MLIVGFAFIVTLALILGPYWVLVVRPEGQDERALRRRLRGRAVVRLSHTIVKARGKLSSVALLDGLLTRWRSTVAPLEILIDASGLQLTLGTVVLGCAFVATVTFFVVSQVTASLLTALVLGILGGSVPVLYLRRAVKKRRETFEEQFPEAIDLIARGLRAGHALTTTLQMVADEIPDPVGREFRQLFEQQNYGMSLPDALRAFAKRIPIIDARFFVTALLTQREMGGNLSEVLDNLAMVIRERFKVKRQVRVVSAHGRITGVVLGLLPPAVAVVLYFIAPADMRLLVQDPLGIQMVIASVVLQLVGVVIMKRIMNVEY